MAKSHTRCCRLIRRPRVEKQQEAVYVTANSYCAIFIVHTQFTRSCTTKVAGSIPDGVTGIFHWLNLSGRIMALGWTQPLRSNEYQECFLGSKGGWCVWLTFPPSCADCLDILEASTSWSPQSLSRPVQWLLYYIQFTYVAAGRGLETHSPHPEDSTSTVPAKDGTLHMPQWGWVSVNIYCAAKCTYLGVMMSHMSPVPRHKLHDVVSLQSRTRKCSTRSRSQHAGPSVTYLCSSGRMVGMHPMRVRDTDSVFVKVINWNYACNTSFSKTWLCTIHALHRPSRRICLATSCSASR
jgi:hypothetical protein